MSEYVIGIDTSNYTSSVAITDESENVIADKRRMLHVKKGERGLRQQEALFQHINNIPDLYENAVSLIPAKDVVAVSVSARPRPVNGSYMPCFKAGQSIGRSIAVSLDVPCYEFSHQEGHIAAVAPKEKSDFLCYHLSGGTCELLDVKKCSQGYDIKIAGGSRDISFGQLIDRVGVALGFDFPAGAALDKIACASKESNMLTGIRTDGLFFNLSGMETQMMNLAESTDSRALVTEMFHRICTLLIKTINKARLDYGDKTAIFAGGVSKSSYIRSALEHVLSDIVFGEYSEDNAVGIAILGGRVIWR